MRTIMIVPLNYNPALVKAKIRGFRLCGEVPVKDNIVGMWGYFRGHVDQLTNVLDRHRQVFRVIQLSFGFKVFLVTHLGVCRGLVLKGRKSGPNSTRGAALLYGELQHILSLDSFRPTKLLPNLTSVPIILGRSHLSVNETAT